MIQLMFLKELNLTKLVHQTIVMFVTIGIFKIIILSLNQMSAIDIMIY